MHSAEERARLSSPGSRRSRRRATSIRGARSSATRPPSRFEAARERYERGHYQTAFDEFAALADGGHCESARVAHQMARHGIGLYGLTLVVAPARLEYWRRAPGCTAPPTDPR
jgi:hypothetical protein